MYVNYLFRRSFGGTKKMQEDESENRAKSSRKWFRFVHDGQLKMPLLPCKKILENLPSHPAPGIWWFIDKKLNVISIQGI